jgi:hypothetical protein
MLAQLCGNIPIGGFQRFPCSHQAEYAPPRAEYLVTDKGRALGPALKALFEWRKKYSR